MGKSSNKRKAVRQSAGLVTVSKMLGVTVRALHAFPPGLMPLVVSAFHHFTNDQTEEGMKQVEELQSHGCNFFDFTMAASSVPQYGDADPLMWAWGSGSRSSLRWLTAECLKWGRIPPGFFVTLTQQLELLEEGSAMFRLSAEVFSMFASHLVDTGVESGYEAIFASNAPRACAIFNGLVAERLAAEERLELIESTSLAPHPTSAQTIATGRL